MFNLDTFMNLFQIQIVELFQSRLTKCWNCTNDQLTSIGQMTTDLILEQILNEDYFVVGEPRILKWAISLVAHMVNRHLRFFSDLMDQSGVSATHSSHGASTLPTPSSSMGTERLLFVINDLHTFHKLVDDCLVQRLCSLVRLPPDSDEKDHLLTQEKLKALFSKILSRNIDLTNKAISCISGLKMTRLKENMRTGFSQLPQKLRVSTTQFQTDAKTGKESHLPMPSKDFLDLIYKPLLTLT